MNNYNKANNIFGWLTFLIASAVYVLTLEPTVSFWDCGEFIAAANRLQVVHQPGAPLFLMIQKIFSLIAMGDSAKISYWMNVGSALASGATIMFLFWSITALARKIMWPKGEELNTTKLISIIGAGLVGALAYTFSDTFWFSAVESEVYAQSSMATAIVFWAILKWDAHADEPGADRWLLFIAYVMGLSIGIHLLNLLTIPAMAFVYYYRKVGKPTTKGIIWTFLIGCAILALVQYGIVQYMIALGAYFDLFFVNTLGMGFGSGVAVFALLVIAGLVYGIIYSIKKQKRIMNLAFVSISLIIFGYGSFAMIIIRAKANPNLNNSAPDNAFSFLGYLNREQYGDRPLLYGQYYNSKVVDYSESKTLYRKGKDKYEVAGKKTERSYDRNTLLPRMFSEEPAHVAFYKEWMRLGDEQNPNFTDNIGFFLSYQTNYMYFRYFMWNFAGRQNDEQGQGSNYEGNWISGIKPIDAIRLGDQSHLPPSITENNAYNRFYFLPLILGLMGAIWHFKRNQKDAIIVTLLLFFTGMAIVLYLNQNPLQPRERDYAYAGSFYAFAIWIGLGVLAIHEWLLKKLTPTTGATVATVIGLFAAPVIMAKDGWNDHDRSTKRTAHDLAVDYLESCAPNAILFTYGDNDTYPLWNVQEVEGVRPDIRIVNLSLLGTDWYIRQMKEKMNESAPLPITMKNDQFVQGVRDVLFAQDYGYKEPIELSKVLEVLLSDDPQDKVQMQGGGTENVMPTKSLKLTVNADDVVNSGTVSANQKDKLLPEMVWKYNKNYVSKAELAMFDILAHNNWKRPIYFATTVPSDNYIGLDNFMYNEGFAYRLLPLKKDTVQNRNESLNTQVMYNNMMTKFKWGNMRDAKYLDPESSHMTFVIYNAFNSLAEKLISEGNTDQAKKAINKLMEVMPEKFYTMRSVIGRYYLVENLYKLGEKQKANAIILKCADYVEKELIYLSDVSQSKKTLIGSDNVQLGMSIMAQMAKTAHANGDEATSKKLEQTLKSMESRFNGFF